MAHASAPGASRSYLAIDLKSFYASVECVERGLDPLTARLVVADRTRTDKTICLAVSPALKAMGVRNRCRLWEVPKEYDFIVAPPQMVHYVRRSADVYAVYLRYVAPEDIHVYSIDEAFLDVTPYLALYGCSARELGERIRADVVATTGIPATCGLGTNLYLAKVALDIQAKHRPDFFGELDEESYRTQLWNHTPITDFWRVGPGTARRLASLGIHTMGQVATYPREPLYQLFGIDAEILIDHAWGREPVSMADIKAYRSKSHSLSNGQVLGCDATYEGGLLIAKEMADKLVLDLVRQGSVAGSLWIGVGYRDGQGRRRGGEAPAGRVGEHGTRNWYGELWLSGTAQLVPATDSLSEVWAQLEALWPRVANPALPVHRITVALGEVADKEGVGFQPSLFDADEDKDRERRRAEAVLAVKGKYGKNALLRAHDLLPEATARERNAQIGGHRSGE